MMVYPTLDLPSQKQLPHLVYSLVHSKYLQTIVHLTVLTTLSTTTGKDLEVNYVDYSDASGELIEVGDSAGISANTGSVSFDRSVYPVPFNDTDYLTQHTQAIP